MTKDSNGIQSLMTEQQVRTQIKILEKSISDLERETAAKKEPFAVDLKLFLQMLENKKRQKINAQEIERQVKKEKKKPLGYKLKDEVQMCLEKHQDGIELADIVYWIQRKHGYCNKGSVSTILQTLKIGKVVRNSDGRWFRDSADDDEIPF